MHEAESNDVETTWDVWRERALNVLLVAACAISTPVMIAGLAGRMDIPARWMPVAVVIYVLLVVDAACVRWPFPLRSGIAILLAYMAAIGAMANRGLIGFGRLALLVLPFMILIVVGSRSGWIAAGVSLGIYGVFTAWASLGGHPHWQFSGEDLLDPTLWIIQGLGLALAMVPALILMDRFRAVHGRLLDSQRQTSEQLREEIARRTAALELLERGQAERSRLEQRIAEVGEQERRQLGREIHDGLCQQLTAALLRSSALQEQLTGQGRPEAAHAERLRLLVKQTLDDAYGISKGFSPVGMEPGDLVAALQAMTRRIRDEFALPCEFSHEGNLTLAGPQVAMHLYRIAQEAVTNAAKHAGAKKVTILLVQSPDGITLTVRDDGVGRNENAMSPGGMGLSIMAYRAQAMGGTLSITRAESGGTVVTCRVPMTAKNGGENAD